MIVPKGHVCQTCLKDICIALYCLYFTAKCEILLNVIGVEKAKIINANTL